MNPVAKRVIIILVPSFILFFGFLFWLASLLAGTQYEFAEDYTFNVCDSNLIQAVELFKIENPQYCVPSQIQLKDGRRSSDRSHFGYPVYFYFPEENQILFTLIDQDPFIKETKTDFLFVKINEGLVLGNWKDVNRYFDWTKNKAEKRKFEERILNKIETKLGVKHN